MFPFYNPANSIKALKALQTNFVLQRVKLATQEFNFAVGEPLPTMTQQSHEEFSTDYILHRPSQNQHTTESYSSPVAIFTNNTRKN